MRATPALAAALALAAAAPAESLETGRWHAWLDSPGGELAFGLELERTDDDLRATIVNGDERVELDDVALEGAELLIEFPHYDAELRATIGDDGRRLDGLWRKAGRSGVTSSLPFHAVPRGSDVGRGSPSLPLHDSFSGRWRVDFSSSEEPAVAIFWVDSFGAATGTFLTTTGDYRYLSGGADGDTLTLSSFDGAHAFLFGATLQPDGSLKGDFWSRDVWHETWTAVKDPDASLPDAFGRTAWVGGQDLSSLVFRNLEGEPTSLASLHEPGQPMILEVFGSWCPNCHDAAAHLAELHEAYADRGLRIVGLAFEHTGEFERDARQVRRFADRHGLGYPLLLAGTSDKARASEALPVLDRVRAYPTTIFLDGEGRVRAIHTGFSGPATGAAHERLRESFRRLVEDLLGE